MQSSPRRAPRAGADTRAAAELVAFRDHRLIASGDRETVVRAIFREGGDRRQGAILIFDARTSQPVELDLRGTEREARARLGEAPPPADSPVADAAKRGPGRPRLGVVARELTLLPRHWDWLNAQPGGASAAVRRLVEQARATAGASTRDTRRVAQEAVYRFMSAMAGNLPGFEAATRALFADDREGFDRETAGWPKDLRAHAHRLAGTAFTD